MEFIMQAKPTIANFLKVSAMLSILSASQAYAAGPAGTKSDYGFISSSESANYIIKINAETKSVNVQNGDTVEFASGDKKFTWHFDTFRQSNVFDLSIIAPPEFPSTGVKVFAQPDPAYMD
jgi:alpha-ketoglutarate-dependent taurine dioxygenase